MFVDVVGKINDEEARAQVMIATFARRASPIMGRNFFAPT